jgi:hypothetical protein
MVKCKYEIELDAQCRPFVVMSYKSTDYGKHSTGYEINGELKTEESIKVVQLLSSFIFHFLHWTCLSF